MTLSKVNTRGAFVAAVAAGSLLSMWQAGAAQPDDSLSTYLMSKCPVTGQNLEMMGEPVTKEYEGRQVRFCCQGCVKKFEADLEGYFAKIDAAVIEQQMADYPLSLCVVSGEGLSDMDSAINRVYGNRLVRFCCKDCIGLFNKAADEYLEKLDKAVLKQQKGTYPTDKCIVSGDKLGGDMGDPIDFIMGNRLFRLCCKGCIRDLKKDPAKYIQVLDDLKTGKAVE